MCALFHNIQFHTQSQNIIITKRNSVCRGCIIRYSNITCLFSTLIIYKYRNIIACLCKIVFLFGFLYVWDLFPKPKTHSLRGSCLSTETAVIYLKMCTPPVNKSKGFSQGPFNMIVLTMYHFCEHILHPCILLGHKYKKVKQICILPSSNIKFCEIFLFFFIKVITLGQIASH